MKNKSLFKRKLEELLQLTSRITGKSYDLTSAYSRLKSAAHSFGTVTIEPTSQLLFGFTKEQYPDPRKACLDIRNKSFKSMSSKGTFKVNQGNLEIATARAANKMGFGPKLVPCSFRQAADSLPKNTSSGAPLFVRPKSEVLEQVVTDLEKLHKKGIAHLLFNTLPVYVAWRTQMRDSGLKYRPIYIMPYHLNIMEAIFFRPLFNSLVNNDIHLAYQTSSNYNTVLRPGWIELQNYKHIYGIDYTRFDESISRDMLFYALQYLKRYFYLDKRQSNIFDLMIKFHINAQVFTSYEGEAIMFHKSSGLLSGSCWTNLLGSFINLIMLEYALLQQRKDSSKIFVNVKGDDCIIGSDEQINIPQLSELLGHCFGADIGVDKSEYFKPGQHIYYLGYYYNDRSKFARSNDLLHRKIAYSGRFIEKTDDFPESLRYISKVVSVLANVTNGQYLFYKYYYNAICLRFNLGFLPKYYRDLSESESQSFSINRYSDIAHDLKFGWYYR